MIRQTDRREWKMNSKKRTSHVKGEMINIQVQLQYNTINYKMLHNPTCSQTEKKNITKSSSECTNNTDNINLGQQSEKIRFVSFLNPTQSNQAREKTRSENDIPEERQKENKVHMPHHTHIYMYTQKPHSDDKQP